NTRRQAQQRVHIRLLEQLAADRLSCSAFEEHVVRHDDGSSAMLFENREDMLEKVELLVAGRRPEVVAVNRQALLLRLALLINNRYAALLPEWRIGHHHFIIFAALAAERITNLDRHLVRSVRADAVQQHVHAAQPRHTVYQFYAVQRFSRQSLFLLAVELVTARFRQVIVRRQQEPTRTTRRIADGHLRLGSHHVNDRRNQRPRRKILSRSTFHIRRVLL